jgi:lipoprotein-anchoring transpeptidase ErfK/SrfK
MRRLVWVLATAALGAVAPAPAAAMLDGPPIDRAAAAATSLVVRTNGGEEQITLRAEPGGRVVARVSPWTDFGGRTRLAVVAERGAWLGLAAPELGNGRLGWVRRDRVHISLARVSLVADLSERELRVRAGGRIVRRIAVGVGAPGSPTPTGRFAVTDKVPGPLLGDGYGCCVLVLSGRQTRLPAGWLGGDRLAVHGTSRPWTVGAAASAGCLHAREADLRALMRLVPVGAQILVEA